MKRARKPRVLFVGRTRYGSPLGRTHARKFAALGEVLDYRVLGSAAPGAPGSHAQSGERFRLVPPFPLRLLDGPLFYALLPVRVARELRSFRPEVVIAQSPYEGAAVLAARALLRSSARIVVEVHGDWRTATRLYGGGGRERLAAAADGLAAWALRHADAVRVLSPYTTGLVRELGVEPLPGFPGFSDMAPFLGREPVPLPAAPRVAFVGVLERYKNLDGLAEAWRLAAPRLPGVALEVVGRGSRAAAVEALARDLPGQVAWREQVEPEEVAELLDRSTCLVLPSFAEGLGRVVVEALARGRPVVGSRSGGIPDLVEDGVNGLLVPPGDAAALADALVRLVGDQELAARLAGAARSSIDELPLLPGAYAERVRAMVDGVRR